MIKTVIQYALLVTFFNAVLSVAQAAPIPWVMDYGNQLSPEQLRPYTLVVLDAESHPLLAPLLKEGATVLARLRLAELDARWYGFSAVKQAGLLLDEKTPSAGHIVDIRDIRWTKKVVEELLPAILHQGFSGIVIDKLDSASQLERRDAKQYSGMQRAAVQLVTAIRRHYPNIKIMLNGSYQLLPELGEVIDMQLVESLYSHYHPASKVYQRVDRSARLPQLEALWKAQHTFPKLRIFTLDYWSAADSDLADLYQLAAGDGFNPYVSIREPEAGTATRPGLDTIASPAIEKNGE